MKKKKLFAVLLAAVMLVLQACGSGSQSAGSSAPEAEKKTEESATQSGDSAQADAAETEDGEVPTIVIYNSSGAINYNNALQTDPALYEEIQNFILEQTGACDTFDVIVQTRQRTGWQGLLKNSDGAVVAEFQSEMELLKLIIEHVQAAQ